MEISMINWVTPWLIIFRKTSLYELKNYEFKKQEFYKKFLNEI